MEKNNFCIKSLFFLFIFQIKYAFSGYFDSFQSGNISENANIIDTTDYHNLYLLITTEKKIYKGIPPNLISETNSKVMDISAVATYDTNYITLACSENYLLSKIKIETGEEEPLLTYSIFNLDISNLNYLCSISILDNIVYIGISQIIDNSLKNNIIKVELINNNDNNGPIVNDKILFSFNYQLTNLNKIIYKRQISCEIIEPINDLNNPRLVCGYIKYDSKSKIYTYFASVMNSLFNEIEDENQIISSKSLLSFRLQKINSTYIKYIVTKNSYEIYLKEVNSKYHVILIKDTNAYLYSFYCMNDLFYYHNKHIFSSRAVDTSNVDNFYLYTKKDSSPHTIRCTEQSNRYMEKVMGFYDENNDKYVFYYQYLTIISYFTLEGMDFLFYFKCQSKTAEIISNTTSIFNVTELITYPLEHELLHQTHVFHYISAGTRINHYENSKFELDNQILTVYTPKNEWIIYYMYFAGGRKNGINLIFTLSSCTVNIRTCAYKCGSCSQDYNICDLGECKLNFAMLRDSEDTDCYANDQNMPNYIYDKDTKYFEKCYPSCKFCSKKASLSSNLEHNCLTCKEGYLKSYIYMGNCYKIEYPLNESNIYKKVNKIENEYYTVVDSCDNNYIIAETGECVSKCPKTTNFNSIIFNPDIDFAQQTYNVLDKKYTLKIEDTPKYLLGNLCYQKCPNFTSTDEDNDLCKCLYGWEQNSTTKEITCYNNKNYCLSKEYYYHLDTKECVLEGCRDGYYQYNFECYKNNCPDNTSHTSLNSFICESNLDYCYIDKYYKTHCDNKPYSEYHFRYKDTKIYLKNCNESLYFFGNKTYLYRNICFEICPENTYNNDIDGICSCNYYKNFLNKENTEYECLSENEKCENINKISVKNVKECIDNLEACINENYKIFNEECYPDCPNNTAPKLDNVSICTCQYYYYNQSNNLTCYNPEENCENLNYPFKKFNTKECFKTKEECFQRNFFIFDNLCYDECPKGTELYNISENSKECILSKYNCTTSGFKYFNKICYKNSCPSNLTEKYNDGICICNSYYFNNSDILDCFEEGITCETHSPSYLYTNINTNECFNSLDECKKRELKIFNNNCYNNCPENTKSKNGDNSDCICSNYFITNDNNRLICFDYNETCETKGYLYINSETKECFNTKEDCINKGIDTNCVSLSNLDETDFNYDILKLCNLLDFLNNNCKIKEFNAKYKDELISIISKDILNGKLDSILLNLTQGYTKDIIVNLTDIVFSITTSYNQNNNEYYNLTRIILGDCEDKLRSLYNVNDTEALIIFKIDYFENGLLIPIVYYEIFSYGLKKKLNMSICKDNKIDVILPASINEDKLFLYNSSNEYYKDKCYKYTSDKGTDILLDDRKNEYISNNMSLCEKDCDYNGYYITYKKAFCKCKVKLVLKNYTEISNTKDKLMNKFIDIKSIANLDNLKCYKLIFKKDGLKNNIGSSIILFIISIYVLSLLFFIFKGFELLMIKIELLIPIESILKSKRNSNFNEISNNDEKIIDETNEKPKKKISKGGKNDQHNNKNSRNFNIIDKSKELINNSSYELKNRKNSLDYEKTKKNKIVSSKKNVNNFIKYNDYEMNSLSYKKALLIDQRTYLQYYFSLLRTKQLIIFTFYTYDDFNSKTIKIASFFFYISLFLTVNALFFDNSTFHRIYEDEGIFNFVYHLPKILYSCLISTCITSLIRYFSITESNIMVIRKENFKKDNFSKLYKFLTIKFILFFSLCFAFLIFFWYYLATFCALYQNTQIFLIKDTLISFGLSLFYPLIINLFPGIFRILSLKNKKNECMYKLSQYIQIF